MKNKLLYRKKVLQLFSLFTFLFLFVNTALGQYTYTWNGSVNNDWATAANWTRTGTGGTSTTPGGAGTTDLVVISNGGTPALASGSATIARLTINNATGPITGSTLTINSGATLNVSSASITNVALAGGNIINNGTLAITTTSIAASLSGITCNTPSVLPSSPTEYGYSGTGILTINISAGTNANSAAIFVQAVNANTTYRMNVTRANTTFTLATAATSFAFRTLGGPNASSLIISGTGVTLGTFASRVRGGLLSVGGQSAVTIDSSVTLEMNSVAANTTNGIALANGASASTTTFTNNGTINILGDTTVGGIEVAIGQFSLAALTNSNISAINNGTINVDIAGSAVSASAAYRAVQGAYINITSAVTFTNNGTLTFKNSAFGTNLGYSILGSSAGQRTNTTFVNNGTANFLGTIANIGQGFTITNNNGATINANTGMASFPAITNNLGATFNFTKSPAIFTVLTAAAATAGAVYTDGSSNTYTVTTTKVTSVGTQMLTEVDPITAIPATGTLTRVSGTGDASIDYTVVSTQASALPAATTNSGTINTGASSRLGTISGVTAASTGVIDPGGASKKGIIDFATGSNLALNATLRMQLDPGAVAGQHFDRMTNSTAGGGFTITNMRLDVTGIYTPAVDTTIDIITVNATGALNGTAFLSVAGLITRWAVVVTNGAAGKVSLVYTAPVGIISAQSGPWSDTATWAGGVVPDATSPSVIVLIGHTVTADTAITRDAGTTTTIDIGATLATNLTYTNNGTTTINGTFRINQGGFGGGSGTWTYGLASTLVFNHTSSTYGPIDASHTYWPSTNGPINVTIANSFTAPNGISLGVARTVNGIFQTAAGITNANNLTVNGSLQLNAGGFVSGSTTYGSSSTLIYNSATYGRGDEWTTALSGAGYPNNVQIGNGVNTTLNLVNGSVAYRRAAGNLVVSAGSTLLISGLTTGVGTVGIEFLGNINNDGNITLDGGTNGRLKCATMNNGFAITNGTSPATINLSNTIGGDLELTGNYNDNATFTANQRAVFFTGGSAQTIGGNAPGTFNIDYLVVNKTTTAFVTLLRNIVVGAPSGGVGMTLTDNALDRLELNGFTLTLGTASTVCTVSGTGLIRSTAAAPGSLVINGTGAMGTLNFGSGNNFLANLTINRTAGSGTAGVTFASPAVVTTSLVVASTSTLTLANTGGLTVSATANNTVNGIIAGAGSGGIVKTGTGILTLAAASGNNTANTYTGGTIINTASSGAINVTGLANITSTAIAQNTQSVTFSSTAPTNGTYRLLPGALTVGTESFSHNADGSKIVTFDYPTSTVTVASSTLPTISGAATTAAFTTTYGAVSAAQSFPVSGANLTADLIATATAPYRVSTDGITFGSSVTFTQTAGSASGTLFIRLGNISVNAGSYNSQNIVLSSAGATSVNIVTPASGNTVSPRAITITAPTLTKQFGSTIATGAGSTFFTITTGALQNSETIGSITLDSTGAAAGAAAGTYPTVPSLATGGTFNAANYTITYTNGTLTVAAPATGDYRSVANGNWSSLTTWERWNGTTWATPTAVSTEGWPGQNAVTSRVFISDNNTVTADMSISGTNRPTRLEFLPNANNAVLNINAGVSLGINGNVVIASIGPGSGDAILNVGSGSLPIQGLLRLNDTPGSDNDCELRIGTGSVSVSGTDARMLGAADENLIIFDGAGTLSTLGATTVALAGAGTFTAGTGTVIFDGAAQTVGPYAFNNVTLSGSGTKTITASSIAGNLTISGTAKARLTSNYSIPSLVISGLSPTGQTANTYGSTISSATIQNDTYFDNATGGTGIITVTSNITAVVPTIGTYTYTGLPQGPIAATNSGTGSTYTFSYTNNGGTAYGPTSTPPTNAGNYFVTVTVAADGVWPAGNSGARSFSIAKRALTITANNFTKQFGSTILTGSGSIFFTITSGALQNGETIGSITFNSTGAAAGAAVGTYPTVATAAAGGTFLESNYSITYANGTLTVAAPTAGNYRSKASGDWTTLGTWEIWNGSAWVEPTSVEGYPAEKANVTRVDILNSHNISCGVNFYTTTFRPGRIEVAAGANDTSLTFTSNYIDVSSALVLTSVGGGNALVNVANTTIYSTGTLSLGLPIGAGTCKVIINNGSVNFGSNIVMAGNAAQNSIEFTGTGTMTSSGGTISGGTIVAGTGTVQYTSNTAQSVGAYTFNNLYLSSTSTFTKTLNASAIINGNLTVANAAVASLAAGINYTIDSLILGGVGRAAGTWGHTNSSPTNINDTFFAATTGYLTVGKSAPDVTPTVGTYVYNGLAQGPNAATNNGTGASYTFSYRNSGGTSYGPTATAPTNAGNYTVTVTVAASIDGLWSARSSAATAFTIGTAALTITANSDTKIVGATYTVGAGSTAFTSIGLQNSETIGSITISSPGAVSTAAQGTYGIVPSAATGGTFTASNYTITYTNGFLTVIANTGDYRTKDSSDWTTLSTWQRWNGTAWVEPTSIEGYPCQNTFPTRVTIQNGHNVTCGIGVTGANRPRRIEIAAGANNTSLTFTSSNYFEISGNLVLTATGAGSAFVNVNAAYLGVTDAVSLGNTPSSATDCEVVITTGALYVFNDGNLTMNGAADENAIRVGSGFVSCAGNITGGTIVAGTGTVEYNGAAQTVGAYNFYNLKLSGTLTKTLNAATVIAENLTIADTAIASLNAGTTYTVNSLIYGTAGQPQGTYGSTTSAATNKNDTYFASTGILDVTLSTPDISVTLGTYIYTGLPQGPNTATNTGSGTNYTFSYRSNGGTVYPVSPTPPTNAGNYFVTVTLAADGSYASRKLVDTAFSISRRALTVTANNGTKEFGTSYTTGSGSTLFTPIGLQNSETIGSVTIASTGAVSTAALGTYPIVASAATGGTFTASNYTITYADGTLTVVQNTGDYRSKSSGDWTTLTTWERWNGTAWVEPTGPQGYPCQNAAPFRVDILNGHAVTCGIGVTGANRLTRLEIAAGANDTSLTFTASTYFETIGNIVVTTTGAGTALLNVGDARLVATGSGLVRLNNLVSPAPGTAKVVINNGTLVSNGNNLQMIGDAAKTIIEFTGAGLLQTAGATTNAISGGTIIPGAGTVEFMGAAQTVGIYNFNNLTLSGSGVKTIHALTTITGNVRIAGTAIASLNTGTTYNVDTLTLDCGGTVSGTWGPTSSIAANVNDTYFAATTGMLNVATDSSVNPLAVIAVVQPTCTTATGTVTVTVQIITDTYSFDNGLTYQTSNVKSGLAVGSYNVIIKHRSGCLSPVTVATLSSATKTWNGSANSDWNNAANWTPSGVPVATNCIIVPDVTNDLIINGTNYTAQLYSLTVANGVTVTVQPTNSLIVTDFITVNTGGTLMVQNNANLVQVNNATNTGNIIYQRTPRTQVIESDYIYWSSPVSGMTLEGVSPGDYTGGFFYSFDSTTDNWTDIPINTTMVPGLGYIMRGQKTHNNPFTINATFTGVPNNGPVNAPTGLDGNSVLLGNPYPSAIDADKFLADNSTKIEGTLYFWTHRTPRIGNEYTVDDYASYNGTGSVAVSGGTAPTGKIAACQGFFTTSLGAGDATFTNDMRLVGGIPLDNTNFYKTKNQNPVASTERNRVWLNLTSTTGLFKQLLVGYVTDATNEYDSRFDGKSFDGNEFVDFYSINQNKNLTIQGRALPFDENDVVPLGFRSKISGDFSINIHKVDGALTNQDIVIEDKLTNTFVNLKNGTFSFSTAAGTFNDRFVLRYIDKTLSTNDVQLKSNKVLVSIKNKQIKVNSFSENIDKVTIYDLLGRQIYQKTKVSGNELILSNFVSSNQTLLVKTTLQNGSIVTEKVIY